MDVVVTLAMSLEGDCGVGIVFLEFTIAGAEMVVQRAFLPNTVLLAPFEENLHVDVGKDFEEEYATNQANS